MEQVYIVFFKIFIFMLLGFILNKTRVIDMRAEKTLTEILLKAVLPFSIVASSQYTYSVEAQAGIIAVGLMGMAYYALSLIVIRLILSRTKIPEADSRIMTTCMVFANTGFIGFPLMESLYGDYGLLLAAIFNLVYNMFFYTYGAHLLSNQPRFKVSEIFTSTVSIASVLALILFAVPWRMPAFILETISLVGDMTVPLAMMVMGSMLAAISPRKLFADPKQYAVSIVRLLLLPGLVMLAVWGVSHFIPLSHEVKCVTVLMCALPCGSMNVMYSEKYNTSPEFCARTVALSMVFMMATLLLWTSLTKIFF